MAFYEQDVLDRVREANDIVSVVSQYVPLKPRGGNFWGLCPFHREKSPSFSVSEDKQIFKCFGCGAGGNVMTFIQRVENYSFIEAVKFLADRARISLPESGRMDSALQTEREQTRKKMFEVNKAAARFFYERLKGEEGRAARDYLDKRQVALNVRLKYGLGYSPDDWTALTSYLINGGYDGDFLVAAGLAGKSEKNGRIYDKFRGRLMFPIFDSRGDVTGFGGRVLSGDGDGRKYLNSSETPVFDKSKSLYSVNFARKERSETIIVAEGYMDVIALYQFGFRASVAALGTAFGAGHVSALKKICKRVVLLFDSDEAGLKAAQRAVGIMDTSGLETAVLRLDGAKDPDEFLRKYGAEAFQAALDEAPDSVMFRLNAAKDKRDVSTYEGKLKYTREAADIIAGIGDELAREIYEGEVERVSGVDKTALAKEVEKKAAAIKLSSDAEERRIAGLNEASFRTAAGEGKQDAALDEARRHLLFRLTQDAYHEQISAALTAEEFCSAVYIELFRHIAARRKNNADVVPAAVISLFAEPAEQQAAANVFADFRYDDVEKAVADHIKRVKLAFVQHMIAECTANEAYNEAAMWQNRLKTL